MDDDEATALLVQIKITLAEVGAFQISEPAWDDEGEFDEERDPGPKVRLRRLLNELRSVLVEAPKMVAGTMDALRAERVVLATDPDVEQKSHSTDDLVLDRNDLEQWIGIAQEADALLRELDGRLG